MKHTAASSLIPVEEAARTLQTTPLRLLMQLKQGALQGEEIEGSWYLTQQSVAALKKTGLGPVTARPHCGKGPGCGGCS